jgi:hypothetical protein
MRVPASEKLEIIRLVEQSHLPVRRAVATLRSLDDVLSVVCAPCRQAGAKALEGKPGPGGCETGSRRTIASRSSNWRWSSRSCRRERWRRASPM